PPQSGMDILSSEEIYKLVAASMLGTKDNPVIDSRNAYGTLTDKIDDAAKKREEPEPEDKTRGKKYKSGRDEGEIRSMTRSAGNSIVRTLLGVLGLGGKRR